MWLAPLFLVSKEPNPSRPEPPFPEENKGRDVECIRVSSRSRTSVLVEWNGVFRVLRSGVDDREAVAGGDSDERTSTVGFVDDDDEFNDQEGGSDLVPDSWGGSGVSRPARGGGAGGWSISLTSLVTSPSNAGGNSFPPSTIIN
jgi:hypothetical protein